MKIERADGSTLELGDEVACDILDAVCIRWGVDAQSPLIATIEPLIDLVIEETACALFEEGFCAFDWHRRPFEPVVGNDDLCTFCELSKAEHEQVACCPPAQLDDTEPGS